VDLTKWKIPTTRTTTWRWFPSDWEEVPNWNIFEKQQKEAELAG